MQCDWVQCDPCSMKKWNPIECSGFYASRLNAVDFMQHDWMQWIPCSLVKCIPLKCCGFHAAWLNEVDSFSMIEWSGFFAAWPQTSRLNAMDSMQRGEMHPDWTQCIQCSVAKWIPIQCSGFYAAWPNWSQLNAVDSMHHGAMDPNWMQWNRCSVIECSVFHAAW